MNNKNFDTAQSAYLESDMNAEGELWEKLIEERLQELCNAPSNIASPPEQRNKKWSPNQLHYGRPNRGTRGFYPFSATFRIEEASLSLAITCEVWNDYPLKYYQINLESDLTTLAYWFEKVFSTEISETLNDFLCKEEICKRIEKNFNWRFSHENPGNGMIPYCNFQIRNLKLKPL